MSFPRFERLYFRPYPLMLMLAVLLLTLSAGLLLAQETATPEVPTVPGAGDAVPTHSPEDCEGPGLINARNTIKALLDDFDRMALVNSDEALATLYSAGEQYRQLALDCGYLPANLDSLVINSTDVAKVLEALATLSGDPLRGQLLYNGQEATTSGDKLGCSGCHEGVNGVAPIAPRTEGTWTRWDEVRSKEPRFVNYTFDQYVVESILLPWDYFVPTFPEYTMPDFYHTQLGYQDLADIVAFLNSQDQLITPEATPAQ